MMILISFLLFPYSVFADGLDKTAKFMTEMSSVFATNGSAVISGCQEPGGIPSLQEWNTYYFKFGGDTQSIEAQYATNKINQIYPGSLINCFNGSGILVIGVERYYLQGYRVLRVTGTLNEGLDYDIADSGRYLKLSDGKNYIKADMKEQQFIDIYLPILAETAEIIGKKQFVNFRKNELMDLMNQFYRDAAAPKDLSMFEVSKALLLEPEFRELFLKQSEQYLKKGGIK
jgi:hypothetical protein